MLNIYELSEEGFVYNDNNFIKLLIKQGYEEQDAKEVVDEICIHSSPEEDLIRFKVDSLMDITEDMLITEIKTEFPL